MASLVREGAAFADVGTDHAYLPLFLLAEGRVRSAVASDVAKGPLERAARNIEAAGYEGRIKLLLANGLCGMQALGLTDIAVCGMGGEIIAEILEKAPFVKNDAVQLLLQPMTRADALRQYLAASGFGVRAERYVADGEHIYLVLSAFYDGRKRQLSATDAVLGERGLRAKEDRNVYLSFLDKKEREAKDRLAGKTAGGADTRPEEEILAAIVAEREALL